MSFLPYQSIEQPHIAALLELYLLGKIPHGTIGVNGYGQNPIATFNLTYFFNEILDTKVWSSKIEVTKNAITRRSIRNKRGVAGTREEEGRKSMSLTTVKVN